MISKAIMPLSKDERYGERIIASIAPTATGHDARGRLLCPFGA